MIYIVILEYNFEPSLYKQSIFLFTSILVHWSEVICNFRPVYLKRSQLKKRGIALLFPAFPLFGGGEFGDERLSQVHADLKL